MVVYARAARRGAGGSKVVMACYLCGGVAQQKLPHVFQLWRFPRGGATNCAR